jgi:DNA-binding transcriptional MerR regulator
MTAIATAQDGAQPLYRIGDVAQVVGVTPRTIRYYEELGLLGEAEERAGRVKGRHRLFSEADVERLGELLRLRDLLGLSLEELTQLAEAAQVRQCLRNQWATSTDDTERARIIRAAIPQVERQRALIEARQQHLADFATELDSKLERMHALLSTLEGRGTTVTDDTRTAR